MEEEIDAKIKELQAMKKAIIAHAATSSTPTLGLRLIDPRVEIHFSHTNHFDTQTPRVEFLFAPNCGFIDREKSLYKVKHFVVFSGECFNLGEDVASRIVDRHAKTLESVVYCPRDTKGGIFIRPKYHEGNRGGTQEFPRLTYICMNYDQYGDTRLPVEYGWQTPMLQFMSFRLDDAAISEDAQKTLAVKCFAAYPTLIRVDFIVYPTDGSRDYARLDFVTPLKTFRVDEEKE